VWWRVLPIVWFALQQYICVYYKWTLRQTQTLLAFILLCSCYYLFPYSCHLNLSSKFSALFFFFCDNRNNRRVLWNSSSQILVSISRQLVTCFPAPPSLRAGWCVVCFIVTTSDVQIKSSSLQTLSPFLPLPEHRTSSYIGCISYRSWQWRKVARWKCYYADRRLLSLYVWSM
jgi:hypothetical protein